MFVLSMTSSVEWTDLDFKISVALVYSSRARAENPLGTNFDVNRKPLSLVASFKQISLISDFIHFFHMYIAPGQGQTILRGQNSDVNRKALSFCPFVASFKKISLKSDLIHIFACFYTCI